MRKEKSSYWKRMPSVSRPTFSNSAIPSLQPILILNDNRDPPSAEDERVFLLDQALSFRSGILDGDVTFAWRDLSGDPGDMWEFVVNSRTVPNATSGVFEMTVLQCMYERVSYDELRYVLPVQKV